MGCMGLLSRKDFLASGIEPDGLPLGHVPEGLVPVYRVVDDIPALLAVFGVLGQKVGHCRVLFRKLAEPDQSISILLGARAVFRHGLEEEILELFPKAPTGAE